eukprot:TRINITY_DN40703_c0_g1_i1.p1 TRINITY_DN40703_c0_g1~~TRINITY_DN40703_c0_g1_i1.p1  ORF type:complete len:389 (-),score=50.08 TRINITY_DN40703_c0_g1_i1:240-1406(-)
MPTVAHEYSRISESSGSEALSGEDACTVAGRPNAALGHPSKPDCPGLTLDELKKDTKNVGIAIAIEGLSDILEMSSCFYAKFSLMMWVYFEESVGKPADFRPPIPAENWLVTTAVDAAPYQIDWNDNVFYPHQSDGWNYVTFYFKGTWHQRFNLRHFPYDIQQLWFTMRFNSVLYPRRFFVDKSKKFKYTDGLRVNQMLTSDDWYVHQPQLILADKDDLQPPRGEEHYRCTELDHRERFFVIIAVERASWAYLRSFYFPCFCFGSMTFLLFAAELHDVSTKISTGLTLVLTIIALRFVIDAMLPRVGYATPAERYILFTFFFASLMTFVHSYVGRVYSKEDEDVRAEAETRLFIAQLFIFAVEHLLVLIQRLRGAWRENQIVDGLPLV